MLAIPGSLPIVTLADAVSLVTWSSVAPVALCWNVLAGVAVPIPIEVTESPVPTIDPAVRFPVVVIPRLTFGVPVRPPAVPVVSWLRVATLAASIVPEEILLAFKLVNAAPEIAGSAAGKRPSGIVPVVKRAASISPSNVVAVTTPE